MKTILCFILVLVSRFCPGQGPTPVTITSRATFNGDITSAWFIADVSSTQTRKVSGSTILQTAVKYVDTAGMLAPYARAFDYYRKGEADVRYLQSFTESDPIWAAASVNYFTKTQSDARYLQSFTETDPIWTAAASTVEIKANKATSLASADNIKYPTTLAVSNAIAGFISANQNISISNDASGSGTTAISLTVNGLKGVALPSLGATAGLLKYTGTGTNTWVFDNSTYLTANQSISFAPTGDVTGSTSGATSLAPALTIGARKVLYSMMPSVTDGKLLGRSAGSVGNAMEIAIGSGLSLSAGTLSATGGGTGSVTSVDLGFSPTASAFFSASGGPITTSGTITVALQTQTQHTFFCGPASGVAVQPTFRTIDPTDIPTLNQSTTGTAANITGVLNAASFPAMTGDVTNTQGTLGTTIAAGSVTLAKQANLAANSIIGNNTGSAATPIALTAAQVKTLLALNNVENTALSTWAGSTSLSTVGVISTGTWSATAISEIKGGTGQTTYTMGDMLYSSSANTLFKLAGNTTAAKQFLTQTGTGTVSAAPVWAAISAGDIPTLNQNTTGTASNITGVLNATSHPALTGDVTTTSGSVATTIGANKVLDGMLRQGGPLSVIGRSANSTGNVADISTAVTNQFLSNKGSTLGFNAFGGQASITAASSGINTTETILTSYTIPASQMIAGTTFRVTVYGTCTSSAANASNIRVRLGTLGTTSDPAVAVVTPTAATTGTSVPFQATFMVTIRTTGSGTGTTAGAGWLNNNGVTGISAAADVVSTLTTTSALNTTSQNIISVTYSSAATTTTSTFQLAAIEIVKM
jgi:hypothetical protein